MELWTRTPDFLAGKTVGKLGPRSELPDTVRELPGSELSSALKKAGDISVDSWSPWTCLFLGLEAVLNAEREGSVMACSSLSLAFG